MIARLARLALLLALVPDALGGTWLEAWGAWREDALRGKQEVVLVKLGGSALTDKRAFEALKTANLQSVCQQLASLRRSTPSRHFILVHGAGSFGHPQAKAFNLSAGGGGEDWVEGLQRTHASVSKLNGLVMEALHRAGLRTAVHVPIFPRIVTRNRRDVVLGGSLLHDSTELENLLRKGFVPVLHGDVVLDDAQNCTVFSGDRILQCLASAFKGSSSFRISSCVFLTDVDGVFDKGPEIRGAKLVRLISLNLDGSIKTMRLAGGANETLSSIDTQISHKIVDVTGGIRGKINSSCTIASMARVPVFICRIATMDAHDALAGTRDPDKGTKIMLDEAR